MKTSKKLILYVDDDPDDRDFLSEAIRREDCSVELVLAENGLEALGCLGKMKEETRLPCLVVLDINMPFLNGKETFERMRNDVALKDVPVIVFSSSEKPTDRAAFANLGVEYVTKPTDINHLYTIANRMVSICC